jgi:hypothetical protein
MALASWKPSVESFAIASLVKIEQFSKKNQSTNQKGALTFPVISRHPSRSCRMFAN